MKNLKDGEFSIIRPDINGIGGGKPPTPPDKDIEIWKPKPKNPKDPKDPKDPKPRDTNPKIKKTTIVKIGKSIGGIIDEETSKNLQKDLGVPVELPTMSQDEIKDKIRKALQDGDTKEFTGTGKGGSGSQSLGLRAALAKLTRPQVDWRAALKKFIGRSTKEFEEVMGHRNFIHSGDYIWTERDKEKTMITEAVCAVDISGSMSDDNVAIILNEIKHMVEAKNVKNTTIVYFHDKIEKITELKGKGAVRKYEGETLESGYTDFKPPLSFMQAAEKKGKLEVALFLTDGFDQTWDGTTVHLPKPKFVNKFIWVILDNPGFIPPWGHMTVYIETNKSGKI